MIYKVLFCLTICIGLLACNPPSERTGSEKPSPPEEHYVDEVATQYSDTVYVPIYSQVYSETKDLEFLLTATLSIRNTSLRDSMYVNDIDYYNTQGERIKSFIEETVLLAPMQTAEFVIEREDASGGTGANFVVTWGSNNKDIEPIFQGVMISTAGQQGVAFTTEGKSIGNR